MRGFDNRKEHAMNYVYIRVSTKEQNEDRQVDALKKYIEDGGEMFMDKQSGKDFNRPNYLRMVDRLNKGDTVFIKSIDRLGRNYEEIIEQWRLITKEIKADIVVIDMPLLDTRQDKNLMGRFIADLVLQILSFVSENERANIRQRQAEGIASAQARGVKFGHPEIPLPDNFEEVLRQVEEKKMLWKEASYELKMPLSTFRFKAKRYRERQAL